NRWIIDRLQTLGSGRKDVGRKASDAAATLLGGAAKGANYLAVVQGHRHALFQRQVPGFRDLKVAEREGSVRVHDFVQTGLLVVRMLDVCRGGQVVREVAILL